MTDERKELKELKLLVRKFLYEMRHVPYRALDCDQMLVHELEGKLWDAIRAKRKKRAKACTTKKC